MIDRKKKRRRLSIRECWTKVMLWKWIETECIFNKMSTLVIVRFGIWTDFVLICFFVMIWGCCYSLFFFSLFMDLDWHWAFFVSFFSSFFVVFLFFVLCFWYATMANNRNSEYQTEHTGIRLRMPLSRLNVGTISPHCMCGQRQSAEAKEGDQERKWWTTAYVQIYVYW